jgi:hypothetical protein
MVVTKKQHKFGSATEESVLPPKTNDKNCIGTMNFISVSLSLPLCPLSTYPPGGEGSRWRIANILPLAVGGEWFGSTPKSNLFFSDYPRERSSLPSCHMQSISASPRGKIASATGHGK